MTPQKSQKKSAFTIEFGRIGRSDILIFTKHLSVALKSGFTLFEALGMLYDQAASKLKKMIGDLMETIQSGRPFYAALEKYPRYFSPIFQNLVRVGEVAGTLDANLNYLARQMDKEHELARKVKSAMMYPILVFTGVFGLGFAVAVFVLPKILPLFKTLDIELPLSTRVLLFIAEAFEKNGILIFAATTAFIVFFLWFVRRNFIKPFTHRLMLMTPFLRTIVRNVNLQRFTLTLGTLLKSGMPLDSSLDITANSIENRVYKKATAAIIVEIKKGNKISEALAAYPKLFPPLITHMVAMGERTGTLDETLRYLSGFYEKEVDSVTKNLSTILEPLLLMFIGLMVGTVAIAILGPIYKISGNLRK